MSKVSVALCTYNGAQFLDEQLESFCKQTRLPDELIVCDDCSPDETAAKLKSFAAAAPFPVQIFENEMNLRSTKNFEKAIALCTGDVIFLSDQDDYWLPHKIERMLLEFEKNVAVGLVFSNAEIVGESLQPLGRNLWDFTFSAEKRAVASSKNLFDVLISQNAVTGATMAFRAAFREIFTPIPDDIPNLIHDGWISLTVAALAEVVFVEENLIKYRQHPAQQLGINFARSKARRYSQRRDDYDHSIEFGEGEIARLRQLEKIFPFFKQFERHRDADFEHLIEEKKERIEHYRQRRDLPEARFGRIAGILKELASGRYHRYSRGFLSAAKDFFEK